MTITRIEVSIQDNCLVAKAPDQVLEKCYDNEDMALQDAKTLGWTNEAVIGGRGSDNTYDVLGTIQEVDLTELLLKGFHRKD